LEGLGRVGVPEACIIPCQLFTAWGGGTNGRRTRRVSAVHLGSSRAAVNWVQAPPTRLLATERT
jgi:hypothetical protein